MDPSGARLRDWLDLSEAQLYKREDVAILPMGFCYLMLKLSKHLDPIFVVKHQVQHSVGQKRVDLKYRSVSGQCGYEFRVEKTIGCRHLPLAVW